MNDEKKAPEKPEETTKTALYASDEDPVVLRPHVYDGIQEYDQKLPNWWLFTFYIMIVWFVVFWIAYYQFDMFKSPETKIAATMALVNERREAELEELLATLDNKSLVQNWASDQLVVARGQQTFNTFCKACHAEDLSAVDPSGQPLQGLSLIDGEWKFGGEPMDIFKIINDGSPPSSDGWTTGRIMVPWKNQLSGKAIAEVTAYVISQNRDEFAKHAE